MIGIEVAPANIWLKMPQYRGKPGINIASKEELMRTPGLDKDVADEITRKGPYQSAADLDRIALVGQKRVEPLRESLSTP